MTMFPQPAANAPQNWGEALRHVSPLLLAMSRGLGEGRGAMMYAPQGMAMMAQRDQAARDEAMRAEQMKWQRGMDQQRLAIANAQQGLEQQRFDMQRDQFDWARTQQENAAKLSNSMIGGMDWLFQRESGGNFGAANSEGYVGRGQFGQDRLDDFSRAHGIGRISTEQFRGNPEMQKSVEAWHFADINDFVSQRGLGQFEGQQINGVPVTRAGIVAMAHLGGKGGAARYLATGGKYDPADSNGTRLSDYLALGARATAQQAQVVMMHPGATAGQREMAQMILAQMQPAAPAERRIIEGADGYKYYEDTGERVLPGVQQQSKPSEKDAQIQRLIETGLTYEQAVGIADGRYVVSRNHETGQAEILDKASGRQIGGAASPPQQPGAAPVPSGGDPAIRPIEGADRAFGLGGMAARGANAVGDFIGVGQPYPLVGQAQSDLSLLRERLLNRLADAYSRMPPSWLMREIRDKIPDAGGFLGPEKAAQNYRSIAGLLEAQIRETEQALRAPMKPPARADLEQRLTGLNAALSQVMEALQPLEASGGGITQDQIDLMNELLSDG